MQTSTLKIVARNLRRKGFTTTEIQRQIGVKVPKATMSYWFRDVDLSPEARRRLSWATKVNLPVARLKSGAKRKKQRLDLIESIYQKNLYLEKYLDNRDIGRMLLSMLYLGEGGKGRLGGPTFANSDPRIIQLYLKLFRSCFSIDEKKIHVTVQCRADQNTEILVAFWSEITGVPKTQFYKSRIDPRTVGKETRKTDYKGVCRLDYFSTMLFNEVTQIYEVILGR